MDENILNTEDASKRERRLNYLKEWRKNNKERVRENNKKYSENNKDRAAEYKKENKDRANELRRGRNGEDRERYNEYSRGYKKQYRKTPAGRANLNNYNRKRRALKFKQLHPSHNFAIEKEMELERLRLENETGISYSIDHIWPLTKGGLHHHENLQVIPTNLNSKKNNSLEFKHEGIKHWTDLPEWLIEETKNWKN